VFCIGIDESLNVFGCSMAVVEVKVLVLVEI